MFHKKFWAIIAVILFLANTSLLAATPYYAIVIDAGSTGSRLHLFQYEEGKKIPVITELLSEKTAPGLSSFADDPENAGPALATILDKAKQVLISKQINLQDVSLYLLGTGGMRLLEEESPTKAATIYSQVSAYIKQHYAFALADVGTVPEKMEGIYGWLDVNYISHHFDTNQDETVGTIDMGGASTEITYSTQDKNHTQDEVVLRMGGIEYVVFSKNFLRLGQDQALRSINKNPTAADTCYPTNYIPEPNRNGRYNFSLCSSLYDDLILTHHVSQRILPITNQKFIAYSGIYYTEHFFFENENTPTRDAFETRIRTVCALPWEQLKNSYPKISENYLAMYCANGAYFIDLLYEAYGLKDGQVVFQNKVGQQEIDWTLGALLYRLV
jgi:apyrase